MKMFFHKYKLSIVLVFIGIIFIICFSFAINSHSFNDNALSVYYLNEKDITVSSALPITDSVGKKIDLDKSKMGTVGYMEFEVKSKVEEKVKYELFLTKNDNEMEIPIKFVKVYLTDENDVAFYNFDVSRMPTYDDLKDADSDSSGKLLYSGVLKGKENKKFKFRMWVADTYELSKEIRLFSVKMNVKVK